MAETDLLIKSVKKLGDRLKPPSYFSGSAFKYLLLLSALYLGTLFSLGIAYPWLACVFYRWEAENTYVDGKNFTFDGRGYELFKKYVKWLLLTIITLSVYKLWLDKKLTMWKVSHTHFKGENAKSYYKCGIGEKFLMIVKYYVIIIFTLTLGSAWAYCYKTRWQYNHTVIDGECLDFTGKGFQLLKHTARNILLLIVTLGIFIFWFPLSFKRWEAERVTQKNKINL